LALGSWLLVSISLIFDLCSLFFDLGS